MEDKIGAFDFFSLKKNLKKNFANHQVVRIAILGDSATQLLTQTLRGYGHEVGIDFHIFEADYNQIDRQVLDLSSEMYLFKPEFVILFHSTQKIIKKFYQLTNNRKIRFAEDQKEHIDNIQNILKANLKCKTIIFNFTEINDSVFGNYSNKTDLSFNYQLRKLNFELMNLGKSHKNLFINDVSMLQNIHGNSFAVDQKMYVNADLVFSLDFLPYIAKNLTDIILSVLGRFKKCVILDLDNTLWGGIIGDDGIENIQIGDLGIGKAFTELQLWIKQLKNRGIILAVCSKNDEIIAKEPFEKHPDMVIKLDDVAVFVANWNNKADNIRYIQSILNIGFDSMVFIDDNPFERSLVKSEIHEITVPELPEDPAEYLPYLKTLNLFETSSYTEEDEQRTQQYREESKRKIEQIGFTNEDDFLATLEMTAEVKPFNKLNIPRVAQLNQRSNQFNLRTIRYSEDEVRALADSQDHTTIAFSLKDKFGDYGLISALILKKQFESLFIDTWIMSCRVLKRGMENFVLNEIVILAKKQGIANLIGEYIPTPKNGLVKNHYLDLGFEEFMGKWKLNIEGYKSKKNFIKIK